MICHGSFKSSLDAVNPWSDGLSKADMMSWDLKHPWIPCGCDRSLSRIRVCVMISMQIPLLFLFVMSIGLHMCSFCRLPWEAYNFELLCRGSQFAGFS
jgi:hypothetical protein